MEKTKLSTRYKLCTLLLKSLGLKSLIRSYFSQAMVVIKDGSQAGYFKLASKI